MPRAIKISIAILIIVSVSAAVFFWYQSRRARGLGLELAGPDQILIGVPFSAFVNVFNDSGNLIKDVNLSLNLPEELVFLGSGPEKTVEYRELGNLGVGSLIREEFKLMAIAGENTLKRLEADISYLPFALASRFEKSKTFDIAVRGSGIALELAAPTKIFSGEELEVGVTYRNVSDIDFKDLKLVFDYPPTFNFVKSSLEPDESNNVWLLGDLRKGSEMSFTITGNVIGPDNAFFDFKANIEAVILGRSYNISSQSATLSIVPSPLSLTVFLNETEDYVVNPGDTLNYILQYTNNTDIGLKDAVIKAKLIGEMFDLTALNTVGSLRAADNTIIWNAGNTPTLAVLPAGASESVSFSIKAKKTYPIRRLSDKNFTLKVEAEIESPTVPYFVAAAKTLGMTTFESKVGGQVKVDAQAFFRDAASGILNKGPLPPRVNQATNFTAHWLVTNFSTDVRDVEIRAFLGGNVRFTGPVKSNTSSAPVYNERTQEMIWSIGKIPAAKGIADKPLEAIFQIEVVPSIDQAGRFVTLMKSTALRAVDEFTGKELMAQDSELTSALPDDPTTTQQQGIVIQ